MSGPQSTPTAAPLPLGPPCANHPPAAATWHCPACAKPLCRDCVHYYGGSEIKFASCKKCGGRCDPFLTKAPFEGAVETPDERKARHLRDKVLPPCILAAALIIQLVATVIAGDPLLAILAFPVWVSVAAASYGWILYKLEIECDDLHLLAIKSSAIAALVHSVRFAAITLTGIGFPTSSDYVGGMMEMFAMLGPLALCFLITPAIIVTASIQKLFVVELADLIYAIIGLVFADSIVFLMLKLAGLPC